MSPKVRGTDVRDCIIPAFESFIAILFLIVASRLFFMSHTEGGHFQVSVEALELGK